MSQSNPRRSTRRSAAAAAPAAAAAAPAAAAAAAGAASRSSRPQGVGTGAAPPVAALGRVDAQAGLNATASLVLDAAGQPYDAMLNLLDLSTNTDKYYLLQVVSEERGGSAVFHCYSRWGRTGTAGTCQTFTADNAQAAIDKFEGKFRDKTGQPWAARASFVPQPGKYRLLNAAARSSGPAAKWQYYIEDNVDGKPNGWYDYEEEGSQKVEDLYLTFLTNEGMHGRVVESGHFSYFVDLVEGTQTNTSTRRKRPIRRNVCAHSVASLADVEVDEGEEEEEWDHLRPLQAGGSGQGAVGEAVQAGTCCICFSDQVDSLLYRCGHMCTCFRCGQELLRHRQPCPLCRAPLFEVIRAYAAAQD